MSWDEDFKIIFYSWLRAWKDDHLKNPRFIKVDIDEPIRSGGKISIRIVPYPDLDLPGILFVEDLFGDQDIRNLKTDDNSMQMKMFKINNYKDYLCLIMIVIILKEDWRFKNDADKWLFNYADSSESFFTPVYRLSDLIDDWNKNLEQYWNPYRESAVEKGIWEYFAILTLFYYRLESQSQISEELSFDLIPPKWFDSIPFDEILKSQSTEWPDTPTLREINRLSREYGELKRNWPAYRYHKEHGDRTFRTPEELEKAGPGWFDSPTKLKEQIEREEKEKQLKEKQRKEGIINLKDQYPECYELIALMEDRGESLELIEKACKAKQNIDDIKEQYIEPDNIFKNEGDDNAVVGFPDPLRYTTAKYWFDKSDGSLHLTTKTHGRQDGHVVFRLCKGEKTIQMNLMNLLLNEGAQGVRVERILHECYPDDLVRLRESVIEVLQAVVKKVSALVSDVRTKKLKRTGINPNIITPLNMSANVDNKVHLRVAKLINRNDAKHDRSPNDWIVLSDNLPAEDDSDEFDDNSNAEY